MSHLSNKDVSETCQNCVRDLAFKVGFEKDYDDLSEGFLIFVREEGI